MTLLADFYFFFGFFINLLLLYVGGLENLSKMSPCYCWGFTVGLRLRCWLPAGGLPPSTSPTASWLRLFAKYCTLLLLLWPHDAAHPPPKRFCNSILKFIIYKSALWDCKSHCPWKDKYHLKMRNGTQLLFLNLRYLIKSWKLDSRVIYSHAVFWWRWTAGASGRCFHK